MIFDNVELLGYNHQNKFLGDHGFVINRIKTITIRGYVLDLINYNGVQSIFEDTLKLQKECSVYQELFINGKFFGNGRATSFSVEAGNWVRTTTYSATFEVYENINLLQNFLTKEFDDIDFTEPYLKNNFKFLKEFSENFNVTFDSNSKVLDGSHKVEIECFSDSANINQIDLAKYLAAELLQSSSSNIFETDYLYRADYIKSNSESYNIISNKCSFESNFSYKADGTTDPYYVNTTHSISVDQEGIITVEESGEVIVESESTGGDILLTGVKQRLLSAPGRCEDFFNSYATKISGSTTFDPLNTNKELQKTIVVDRIQQRANYTIQYNNDPKRLNDKYVLTRVLSMEFDAQGIWSITESGSSTGIGRLGSEEKYSNAKLGWSVVSPGVESRILSFYNTYAKNKTGRTPQYVDKNVTFALYRGEITYDVKYSDDPKLSDTAGDGGQYEITVSDTGLINSVRDYLVPNNVYAVQQNRNLKKQGEQTVTARLASIGNDAECQHKHGNSLTAIPAFNGMDYFDILRAKAAFIPSEAKDGYTDLYLESIDYRSNEIEKTAEITQKFKYS